MTTKPAGPSETPPWTAHMLHDTPSNVPPVSADAVDDTVLQRHISVESAGTNPQLPFRALREPVATPRDPARHKASAMAVLAPSSPVTAIEILVSQTERLNPLDETTVVGYPAIIPEFAPDHRPQATHNNSNTWPATSEVAKRAPEEQQNVDTAWEKAALRPRQSPNLKGQYQVEECTSRARTILTAIKTGNPQRRTDRRSVCDTVENWRWYAVWTSYDDAIAVARAVYGFNAQTGGIQITTKTKFVLEFYERYAFALAHALAPSRAERFECVEHLKAKLRLPCPRYGLLRDMFYAPERIHISRRAFQTQYDKPDWRHVRLAYACTEVEDDAAANTLRQEYLGSCQPRVDVEDIDYFASKVKTHDPMNFRSFAYMATQIWW